MTLVEFLAPLRQKTNKDRVLGVLYYFKVSDNKNELTVKEIRAAFRSARIRGWANLNIADALARCGHFVDGKVVTGGKAWSITPSGEEYIKSLLNLDVEAEKKHDTQVLESIVARLSNPDVRGYVEESIKCLRCGALRASIVFLWSGAVRVIHTQILTHGNQAVTDAIRRHDPKCRDIRTIDDFAYTKEINVLLAAQNLGLFDKGQKDTLEEALDLRNRCGHPGKYHPGPKKVSSFIEDLMSIVFDRFA